MWGYKKPTEPGLYYVNRGDVVTDESCGILPFWNGPDGKLIDPAGRLVARYNDTFKFMLVDYEALNKIGNEDEDS